MKTELYSISKIFTERLLRIPDYQRGYAWKLKQLKDYWSDLIQLEDEKNHYVGVITLEDVNDYTGGSWDDDLWIIKSKSFDPYYVVDGQQRLTTTIILIQSICEVVGNECELNYTKIDEIRKKFIFDTRDNGISRSYIFGYEKDNPSYNFLKVKIFGENINSTEELQETIYTQNLINAKKFFIEKLKKLKHSDIEIIYKKVTQNFLFAIYSMSDDIDVFITFETMNNRGKPLSHLELLKNRLIFLSTKFSVDEFEKQTLRKTINDCWKSVYHFLGKNKNKPLDDDLFLFNHFVLYFGPEIIENEESEFNYRRLKRGYKNTYSEYLLEDKFTLANISNNEIEERNKFRIADVNNYVTNLKQSVEIWYYLINPCESQYDTEVIEYLCKLNRIGIDPVLPLILTFFKNVSDAKMRLKLLVSLERFMFYTLFASGPYHYGVYDEIIFIEKSAKLSNKSISDEKLIKEIDERLEIFKRDETLKDIQRNFVQNGFYKWRGVRYFLYEYDLFLKSESKTKREKIDWEVFKEDESDFHTVEHVYPQRPRKPCWTELYKHYTSVERSALRHSLGNLVPLSKPKNSSFQNNCFKEKVSNEINTVGFAYGSYSENEIAKNDDWTAKHILERGVKMLTFLERRWSLPIGNRDQKIKFLGLQFVLKK